MVTPSTNRYKNMFPEVSNLPGSQTLMALPEAKELPPSSIHKISDSTRKPVAPSTSSISGTKRTTTKRLHTVEQTPTRGPEKFIGRPTEASISSGKVSNEDLTMLQPDFATSKSRFSAIDQSSLPPLLTGSPHVQATPPKVYSTDPSKDSGNSHKNQGIMERKARVTANSPKISPATASPPSDKHENSIYTSLGWDDDDIDELC